MIEVKANRTERTATYHLGGDHYQQKCWSSDIHYDNWDGRGDGEKGWRKCDPIIEPTGDGWRVLYMPYNAAMPRNADGVFHFRDCRSVPGERKDIYYTITPIGAAPVPGVVDGLETVYTDAFGPGADLVYQLRASGVAKLVRIQPSSTVTGPFQFRVALPAGAKVLRTNGKDTYELDKRGPKLADSARKTILEIGGKATYLYPFHWRSGMDAGVLPVLIEPDGNDWIFAKSIPAEWTREDVLTIDLTASGTTVLDGYMGYSPGASYIAARDQPAANLTAYTSTSDTIAAKDSSGTPRCFRFVWSVSNTVPADANVSDIDLFVRTNGVTNGGVYANWVGWTPSSYTTPATSDYAVDPPNTGAGKIGSVDYGATTVNGTVGSTDRTVALNAAGKAAFVKNGTNGYACRETTNDFGMTAFAGALTSTTIFYSEYPTSAFRPAQTITYTLPTGYQNMMMMGVG